MSLTTQSLSNSCLPTMAVRGQEGSAKAQLVVSALDLAVEERHLAELRIHCLMQEGTPFFLPDFQLKPQPYFPESWCTQQVERWKLVCYFPDFTKQMAANIGREGFQSKLNHVSKASFVFFLNTSVL